MPRKITELLHTKKPIENPYVEASLGVKLLQNQIQRHQNEVLEPYGITMTQYNALRILRGQYPIPCNLLLIKDRIVEKNSDVSRLVERLRKMDYVERSVNPEDRRSVKIVITERGLDLLAVLESKFTTEWRLPTISREEAVQLVALVEKILN